MNPSVAFKVNDAFSVGAGVNWQRVQADLTKAVNYSFIASAGGIPGVPNNTEGTNDITGNDSAWGFNLGVLFEPTANTDVGLTYRSAISYTLSGNVSYQGRTALLNSVRRRRVRPRSGGRSGRADRRQRGDRRSQAPGDELRRAQVPAQSAVGFAGRRDVDAMELAAGAEHRAHQRRIA